jgi:hypothetical protein
MATNIPLAGGVPGISGPPDWFNPPTAGSFRLDDVRWRGATQRTFGGGASQSASFHAIQATVGTQQFIYLSFRAGFVQGFSDQNDVVYLGLQKSGGTKAMVIKMRVHGPAGPTGFLHVGPPPDTNAPGSLAEVTIWTRLTADNIWTQQSLAATPSWISTNARTWLQDTGDNPDDPNRRWAVQLRIPVTSAIDISDNSGPNLGTDFVMWYLIEASTTTGSAVILADYRLTGTTSLGNLLNSAYPTPRQMINNVDTQVWDQFLLTSGPGAFGGVAINWGDVKVLNARYGEGTTIADGASNTFVARPRNYRPAGSTINAGDISATFRIANWGSIVGQPWQPNFATGVWDLVPGVQPVPSQDAIPALAAGANPPATNPIRHSTTISLGPGKSTHQCILVTLTGNNLNFLSDSVYQNMNFGPASLIAQEAEINIKGLTPFSPQPRDVYLAVEKVNMPRNKPAGTNEGQFLRATVDRLIERGGPLAAKLRQGRAILSDGDGGSNQRLDSLMSDLRQSLQQVKYNDPAEGAQLSERLIEALTSWLVAVKHPDGEVNQAEIDQLAALLNGLADWLQASKADSVGKLSTFVNLLNQWLRSSSSNPRSLRLAQAAMGALLAWLASTVGGDKLTGPITVIQRWFSAGQPADQLPTVIGAFAEFLAALASNEANRSIIAVAANFARSAAAWLRGEERLGTLVDVLNEIGLTDDELDQVFPTLRIHPYYDTGERFTGVDGKKHPVLAAQSSFGIYAYHEGGLDGWQTSLQGAQRIADNLYLLPVPNNGSAKITVKVQAVSPGEERIPEDPIKPQDGGGGQENCGCLCQILKLFGLKK